MNVLKSIFLVSSLMASLSTFAMNKAELVDSIASKSGLSKADSKRALESFLATTAYNTKKGDDVSLVGFGTFSSTRASAKFDPDRPLVIGAYNRYFKNFWSEMLRHNGEQIEMLETNPLHQCAQVSSGGGVGDNPLYDDNKYFSSTSFYADSFVDIFTKLSPTDIVSVGQDEKEKIADELNRALQGTVKDYSSANKVCDIAKESSSKIMKDAVAALLSRAIKQEQSYLDPKSENLALSKKQLTMMLLLFNSNIDLTDGHVTVLKAKADSDGHVTVLKAVDHNGHVTVLKARYVDGHVTVLKSRDNNGHVTVLKISDSDGHVTVLKAMGQVGGSVTEEIRRGGHVSLIGFGSFSISKRAARTGRNPQTGKEIQIAAKNVVRFKAGSELSGKVN